MSKYCSKCGTKLEDTDEFCSNCGASLNKSSFIESQKNSLYEYKKLIFIVIGVIVILFVGVMLMGSMGNGVPLVHADFEAFEMDIPEGSTFEIYKSFSDSIIYENNGKYSEDIDGMMVSTNSIDTSVAHKLIDESDDMKLYTVDENSFVGKNGGTDYYQLLCQKDGLYFELSGKNPDLLKQVSKTIEVTNT